MHVLKPHKDFLKQTSSAVQWIEQWTDVGWLVQVQVQRLIGIMVIFHAVLKVFMCKSYWRSKFIVL